MYLLKSRVWRVLPPTFLLHKNTWKQLERDVAKFLTKITGHFSQRTRGSGSGNQVVTGITVTRSDTDNPLVYAECKKTSKELPFYATWKDAKGKAAFEKKIPVLIMSTTKHQGRFYILEEKHLEELICGKTG